MTTKQKLLEIFYRAEGDYVSGEDIASELDISRNAIWKAVNTLRSDGHEIESVTGTGYKLSNTSDVLTALGITRRLNFGKDFYNIEVFSSVKSTNEDIRQRANEPEGLVIVAREQTAGSGRLGRKFHSPSDTGTYFSVLLKPDCEATKAVFITSIAAVAVCRAIEALTDKQPKIKWVNDIFIDGKKVCGILTQAVFDMENQRAQHIVLGIGINVYSPDGGFTQDIAKIAGAVFADRATDIKNVLTARVLEEFYALYSVFDLENIAELYKSYSLVIGKTVEVITPSTKKSAKVLDIDRNCNLVVEYENGETATLSHGEISLRTKD